MPSLLEEIQQRGDNDNPLSWLPETVPGNLGPQEIGGISATLRAALTTESRFKSHAHRKKILQKRMGGSHRPGA